LKKSGPGGRGIKGGEKERGKKGLGPYNQQQTLIGDEKSGKKRSIRSQKEGMLSEMTSDKPRTERKNAVISYKT